MDSFIELFSVSPLVLVVLFFVAILAGFIDSLAGGGGLLTVPALMAAGMPPAQALATNKLQACGGSLSATLYFVRRKVVNLADQKLNILMTFIGSTAGALLVQHVQSDILKQILPLLVIGIGLYFLLMPKLGEADRQRRLYGLPFALVAGQMFGAWAVPVIALAAALKATGTLGGWMLVTGESGARAAQRGFLPAIFGRQSRNGAATWGLFFVALAMSALTIATLAPTVSGQFEVLIEMVVILIVVTYGAAGLVLLKGSAAHRPTHRERLLGLGALFACALLLGSASLKIVLGAVVLVLVLLFLFIAIDNKRSLARSR